MYSSLYPAQSGQPGSDDLPAPWYVPFIQLLEYLSSHSIPHSPRLGFVNSMFNTRHFSTSIQLPAPLLPPGPDQAQKKVKFILNKLKLCDMLRRMEEVVQLPST